MDRIVFFVFDPSPRIDRRIREFKENGYEVEVYGLANDFNIKYCTNEVYTYNLIASMRAGMPYKERASHIKEILKIIDKKNNKNTVFYFFTINVAVAALFRKIKYIYEESDMLFDRFSNKLLQKIVIYINKKIIKRSLQTVFTSEGFADYYYGDKYPSNISFITNRVSPKCLDLPDIAKEDVDFNHLRLGFVGNIRYQSILNVSDVVSEQTDFEFHYFGNDESLTPDQKKHFKMPRVQMHGGFSNPDDLPVIYGALDFVVCTYDVKGVNPRYAEPNKLYEAIYYRTPMIVSAGSFLAKKVERLGIGISLDPNDKNEIKAKIDTLSEDQYKIMVERLNEIPRESAVNVNSAFFNKMKSLLS